MPLTPSRLHAGSALALLALLCLPPLPAQQPASPLPENKEATVELPPFEVRTEKDEGYAAQNTTSGSRLNTNLADTPAAISEARRQRAIAAGEASPDSRPPSLTVATDNITALTLQLAESGLPADAGVPLKVDDTEFPAPLPPVLHLARSGDTWHQAAAPVLAGKRHGLQGPVGDALNTSFLAVYGKGDRAIAVAELDAMRNPPGRLVIHTDFPMKPAARLSAAEIASSNLLLFGTPATNPVLARLAPRLPAPLMQAIVAGTGVIFIFPNPESPGRYVVVWTTALLSRPGNGLLTNFLLPVNQLPDYILVRDGQVAAGGYFDHDWKLAALPALP